MPGRPQEMADLGDDRGRHEDLTAREVQAGQEVGAPPVLVVPVRSGDQRPGIDDDQSGTSETVGRSLALTSINGRGEIVSRAVRLISGHAPVHETHSLGRRSGVGAPHPVGQPAAEQRDAPRAGSEFRPPLLDRIPVADDEFELRSRGHVLLPAEPHRP